QDRPHHRPRRFRNLSHWTQRQVPDITRALSALSAGGERARSELVEAMQHKSWLWGPLSPLGITVTVLTLVIDQAHKWWMLLVYRIEEKGRVAVTPFLDLVYVKNLGVSYGLFLQEGRSGQWLLAGFAAAAVLAMAVWLARGVEERLVAVSLGF